MGNMVGCVGFADCPCGRCRRERVARHDDAQSGRARYTFPASRDAYRMYGAAYADYIEQHTEELVAKGYVHAAYRSLGEALAGNDGD